MARIGMRNFKTAISVFICILVLEYTGIAKPFFACITAVLVMERDMHTSFKTGVSRLIGTVLGSIIGSVSAVMFYEFLPMDVLFVRALVIPLGLMFIIYLLNSLKLKDAILISGAVFLSITMAMNRDVKLLNYALDRTISTVFGSIVALLVNRFVYPYDVKKIENNK